MEVYLCQAQWDVEIASPQHQVAAVSWLQAFVIDAPYNHSIKVGGDGHTSDPVVHPPSKIFIIISPPITVGIQD